MTYNNVCYIKTLCQNLNISLSIIQESNTIFAKLNFEKKEQNLFLFFISVFFLAKPLEMPFLK